MPHPDLEAPADLLVETAYAKVNVALHVRRRRDDGYHALESLFVFADHGDRLEGEAVDDGAIDLVIDGPFATALDAGPRNLVIRAAKALQAVRMSVVSACSCPTSAFFSASAASAARPQGPVRQGVRRPRHPRSLTCTLADTIGAR